MSRNNPVRSRGLCIFLILFSLAACAAPPAADPTQTVLPFAPFILPSREASVTASVTATETPTTEPPTETPTLTPPPPTPTQGQPTAQQIPPAATPARTNYILNASLNFSARTLSVDETIRYYNNTGVALADVVLAVQPNRYNSVFTLNAVAQDGVALTNYALYDQRLNLILTQPLQPGSAATFTLNFNLKLPAKKADGLFGYDFNQINLVDWYPFIVPYSNGWILHDPMPFGEHLVYDAADIEVNIKTGADVVIAAPAPAEQNGEWTRYRLYGARTFALSASDEFLFSESAVGAVKIRSYYFNGYKAAGEGMLYGAVQAVSLFSLKFAPYPYETLSVVQADIHDGQEYDGLVFVATDFYGQYGGGAKNNLMTIGVHEIAHQWWFGLVGNDQALEPWLDEAMAAYSERIFYEYNYPNYGAWWWQFRVDYFGPGGYVDTTIYANSTFRAYTNAAYLNGAHFIEDLRARMGDDDFFRFLKDYAAKYSRGRVTTQDFFNTVRANSNADIASLMASYFYGSY